MRRVVAVFLALVLLAQMSWAAVSLCCLDEIKHADTEITAMAEHADQAAAACEQGHCHCHHGSVANRPDATVSLGRAAKLRPLARAPAQGKSHIPDGLDRPNWQRA